MILPMLAVWHIWTNLHKLSWAGRIAWILLLVAAFVNFRDAFEHSIDRPWRRMYAYKGMISILAWTYYTALLIGLLGLKDFTYAYRWMTPLLITGLSTSALLHWWEIKNLREKKRQEEQLQLMLNKEERST